MGFVRLALLALVVLSSNFSFSNENHIVPSQVLSCRVVRIAGSFYTFVQPKIGDALKVDLNLSEIKDLFLGSAVISAKLEKLPSLSDGKQALFRSDTIHQGEGTLRYIVQLMVSKDEPASLQSAIVWNSGDIQLGVAELNCR